MDSPVAPIEAEAVEKPKPKRSFALDTFRGITILLMLFVNNIMVAEVSPAIAHGEWTGNVGLADVVFPWFLLAVGVALPFSWAKFQAPGSYAQFVGKAAKRAAILILLGMIVDSAVLRQVTLGLGVLQLIGLAFLLAALLIRTPILVRGVVGFALLVGYAVFLHSTGDFTAEGNGAKVINDVLTPFGLRGLPSALPTGAAVLIGSILGSLWISQPKRRLLLTFTIGAGLTLVGIAWGSVTPHLKPIWTPSYICLTTGLGILLLGILSLLESPLLAKLASPLRAAGTNPILAYVAPILVKVMILQVWKMPGSSQTLEQAGMANLQARLGPGQGAWAYTAILLGAWWLVLILLDWKRIVVKV